MSTKPARRLYSETVSFHIDIENGSHRVDFSMAYDDNGNLREIVYVGRGKIGHGLDILLHELSIKGSRAIQFRDPDSGILVPDDVTFGTSNGSSPAPTIPPLAVEQHLGMRADDGE